LTAERDLCFLGTLEPQVRTLPAPLSARDAWAAAGGSTPRRDASAGPRHVALPAFPPLAPSAPPTPESGVDGAPARPESVSQRITTFFDPKGILNTQAPRNWALASCRVHPFHRSQTTDAQHPSLNKRRQEVNAQNTLARAQLRVDTELQASLTRFGKMQEVDAQKARYLNLFFEPLVNLTGPMLEELADELDADEQGGEDRRGDASPRMSKLLTDFRRFQRAEMSPSLGRRASPAKQPSARSRRISVSTGRNFGGAIVLLRGGDRGERQLLEAVHTHYASRIAESGYSDQMKRATWFRFLHHCGLLGPDGVSFTKAAETFDVFAQLERDAEEQEVLGNAEPFLSFSSWVGALQYVLLNASGHSGTDAERVRHFYDVGLPQCRERLNIHPPSQESPRMSSPASLLWCTTPRPQTGHLTPRFLGEPPELQDREPSQRTARSSATQASTARSSATQASTTQASPSPSCRATSPVHPQGGLYGWQIALAEERMCEPEVQQLVEEFREPLRELFQHYASLAPGASGQERASSRAHFDPQLDRIVPAEVPAEAECPPAQNQGQMMNPINFQALLQDAGLYPNTVQIHTVRQHLRISLARDGLLELTYPAFVECLFRIAFVYLLIYGNDVQQEAPSKWMCLWLVAVLSARCPSTGAKAEKQLNSRIWQREPCTLDSLSLRQLTLFRILDAETDAGPDSRSPVVAAPVPLSSRPPTVCSVAHASAEGW